MSHLTKLWMSAALCVTFVFPFDSSAEAQQVTFKSVDDGLAVMIGGEEFTTLRYSPDLPKPYFSPVRALGGTIITRAIGDPMDKDHPHHKGIWLSVDEVNEIKFWAEQGKILNKQHEATPGNPAKLTLTNHWLGTDGQPVLIETSVVSFFPSRLMVYDITLTPAVEKVTFEDTKEGWFGVRVATTMREKVGGIIVNAEGKKTTKECWGQPSKWVDYTGPVEGQTHGVAIMDHPSNFRPSRYHVRDYGLFSVSPFGEGSYQNDKAKAQPVTLEKGKSALRVRYGLYVHNGDAVAGKVADAYEQFLAATK
jgi:hypothetical protein